MATLDALPRKRGGAFAYPGLVTDASHLTQQPGANEPAIHAQKDRWSPSLCGVSGIWTNVRRNVTCRECIAEIERRDAERLNARR